jgi:hypothetical protein
VNVETIWTNTSFITTTWKIVCKDLQKERKSKETRHQHTSKRTDRCDWYQQQEPNLHQHTDPVCETDNKGPRRKASTKITWVSVRIDDDGAVFRFKGFSTVHTFMHVEFTVKGCDVMSLVDRGGDPTNWCVVYRYIYTYHNYIKCAFIICILNLRISVQIE